MELLGAVEKTDLILQKKSWFFGHVEIDPQAETQYLVRSFAKPHKMLFYYLPHRGLIRLERLLDLRNRVVAAITFPIGD